MGCFVHSWKGEEKRMLHFKGGGSRIADNFEGRSLTSDLEPNHRESLESYIYHTGTPVVSYEAIKEQFKVKKPQE